MSEKDGYWRHVETVDTIVSGFQVKDLNAFEVLEQHTQTGEYRIREIDIDELKREDFDE